MHMKVLKEGKYELMLWYFRGYKFELDCSSYPATRAFQIDKVDIQNLTIPINNKNLKL